MKTSFLLVLLATILLVSAVYAFETECPAKVEAAREKFQNMNKQEKVAFVKKLYSKLTETYPDVNVKKVGVFIAAFLFQRVPAGRVCFLYKRIFKSESAKEDKPKCPAKVSMIRKKFRAIESREDKKAFVKKVFDKLSEKYPEVDEKKVGFFIRTLLFSRDEPKRVCGLYKRIFLGEEPTRRPTTAAPESLKEDKPECGERVTAFRKKFRSLETREEKKAMLKKLFEKLSEKYPSVAEDKVKRFIKVLLLTPTPAKAVCLLYKRIFRGPRPTTTAPEAAMKVEEPSCGDKVAKARETFSGLSRDEKKAFVKKLFKGLSEKYPEVDEKKVGFFIRTLLFSGAEPKRVCGLYKRIFLGEESLTQDKPDCAEKVTETRETFKALEKDEKVKFVRKLFGKLTETYPTVNKRKVSAFIAAFLFTPLPADKVCALYKRIFKSETKSSTGKWNFKSQQEKNDTAKCVFNCLLEELELAEVLRIAGKCMNVEEPLPCFASELGDKVYRCVTRCF